MGLFEDVGNWFGEITGWNDAKRQRESDAAARREAQEREARMLRLLGGFTGDTEAMSRQAFDFARGKARGQADLHATEAARASMKAARTAGLNPGKAAMVGGQQTGSAWLQAQDAALAQALQVYGAQQAANLSAAGMTPFSVPEFRDLGAGEQAMQFGQGVAGLVGGLAGAGATAMGGKK